MIERKLVDHQAKAKIPRNQSSFLRLTPRLSRRQSEISQHTGNIPRIIVPITSSLPLSLSLTYTGSRRHVLGNARPRGFPNPPAFQLSSGVNFTRGNHPRQRTIRASRAYLTATHARSPLAQRFSPENAGSDSHKVTLHAITFFSGSQRQVERPSL